VPIDPSAMKQIRLGAKKFPDDSEYPYYELRLNYKPKSVLQAEGILPADQPIELRKLRDSSLCEYSDFKARFPAVASIPDGVTGSATDPIVFEDSDEGEDNANPTSVAPTSAADVALRIAAIQVRRPFQL
jgi:hypothetical protein